MNLPDPEFLEAPARQLVSLSKEFTMDTRSDIPALWQAYWSAEWKLPGTLEPAQYGVSYSMKPDGRFSYAVGVSVEPMPEELPEGACVVTLSAGNYAVFRNRGPAQELPAMFDAIFTSWLPDCGKKQRDGAVFERYPYDEQSSAESMLYEIWVPMEA